MIYVHEKPSQYYHMHFFQPSGPRVHADVHFKNVQTRLHYCCHCQHTGSTWQKIRRWIVKASLIKKWLELEYADNHPAWHQIGFGHLLPGIFPGLFTRKRKIKDSPHKTYIL
jgi:hypothetical protein